MNKIILILIIFVSLALMDKISTVVNIYLYGDKYPDRDPLLIERNPLARWLMEKTGIIPGNIFYFFISLGTMFLAYYLLSFVLKETIVVGIIIGVFTLVIINNVYWTLKFAGLI